jgi:cytochrome P450
MSEGADYKKVINNANMLNLAAPDGTPGTMTATMYHLLANISTYHRAMEEVRNRFKSVEELTIANSEELVYLDACIRESLRLNPAVLNAMPYQ